MKLVILLALIALSFTVYAQELEWDGPDNSTGTIYRTGAVGIGTTTPLGGLNIYGPTYFSGSQGSFVLTNAYNTGTHYFAIAPNSGGTYNTNWDWTKGLSFDGNSGELQKSVTSNTDIAFSVVGASSSKNMKIYGDGSIVLGNVPNPPGYKLYVQDGILAAKVKVAVPSTGSGSFWMDCVFDKEYNLRNIDSIQQFINTNHHLPDMPSAQQISEAGGVDVLEMFKLQQQKIEELTLYILQLNGEIKKLKQE